MKQSNHKPQEFSTGNPQAVVSLAEAFSEKETPIPPVPINCISRIARSGMQKGEKERLLRKEAEQSHEFHAACFSFELTVHIDALKEIVESLFKDTIEHRNELKRHSPFLYEEDKPAPKIPISMRDWFVFVVLAVLLLSIAAFEYTTLREYLTSTRYRFFRSDVLRQALPLGAMLFPLALAIPIANKTKVSEELQRLVTFASACSIAWYLALVFLIGSKMSAPPSTILTLSQNSGNQFAEMLPGVLFAGAQVLTSTAIIALLASQIINKYRSHFPKRIAENPVYNDIQRKIDELSELSLRAKHVLAILEGRLAEVKANCERFISRCLIVFDEELERAEQYSLSEPFELQKRLK